MEILEKIERIPFSGCWLWTGTLSRKGYGMATVHGSRTIAHRTIYQRFNGEIPIGMTLDHLCRVRCCVNPDHLDPVTVKENVLRGIGPTAINAKKLYCDNGHLLSGDNLRIRVMKDGSVRRRCKACNRKPFAKQRKLGLEMLSAIGAKDSEP